MYVLECGKYTNIVNWKIDKEHDEHHFIVNNIDDFTKQVLPSFFKVAKYDSFQRKLYRWGFIKTRRSKAEKKKEPKSVCYVHPCFRMGDYSGAALMTCSGTSVEICKSTQKFRKRQQRHEENNPHSKKQRIELSDHNNNMQQQQTAISATTSNGSFPGEANNMFMMMNPSSANSNVMMPMPALNNSTMFKTSNSYSDGRIEDSNSSSLHVISRPCSSSYHGNTLSEHSSTTTTTKQGGEDISDILARAQYQRQINRIRMNNLTREDMIQDLLQNESLVDGRIPPMDESNVVPSHSQSAAFGNNTMYSNSCMNNHHENMMQQQNYNCNSGLMERFNKMNQTNFENIREMHRRVIDEAVSALKIN